MHDRGLEVLTVGEVFQSGCHFHEEIIRGAGNPFYVEAVRRVNAIRLKAPVRLADQPH